MDTESASSLLGHRLRTCVRCRSRRPKRQLVRLAVADGAIVVDARQQLPGRGAYLCHNRECAEQVLGDGRRLVRALRAGSDHVTVDGAALLQDWEATATGHGRQGGRGERTVEDIGRPTPQ